jgi:hypothetical protein
VKKNQPRVAFYSIARTASDSVGISLREMIPLAERADYTQAASGLVPLTALGRIL